MGDDHNLEPVSMNVHTYEANNSYRCFHVNLDLLQDENSGGLRMEFMASSGTELLGYYEYKEKGFEPDPSGAQPTFVMELGPLFADNDIKFFYPFTTTFIEIILNREPLPLWSENQIAKFLRGE